VPQPPPPRTRGGPVKRGGLVEVSWPSVDLDAERPGNPRQHRSWLSWLVSAPTAQVRVDHAVGEPVGDPVRPAQRKRGLADASGPDDRHRAAARPIVRFGQLGQLGQFRDSADKAGDRRRQLGRTDPGGGPENRNRPFGAAAQQVDVESGQLRARLDAQLLVEMTSRSAVKRQRVAEPTGLRVRSHQRPNQPLLTWVGRYRTGEFVDHTAVLAERERGRGPLLGRGEAQLRE
jgi:hypothetical protein